jgi:uncharacterized protein (TIGR00251 family)
MSSLSRAGPESGDALRFWIHVTPRARRELVGGRHGDALRVAVKEPPVDGKANAACSRALAEAFGVPRARVDLDPGARGRRKRVSITGDLEALRGRFEELAGPPGLG